MTPLNFYIFLIRDMRGVWGSAENDFEVPISRAAPIPSGIPAGSGLLIARMPRRPWNALAEFHSMVAPPFGTVMMVSTSLTTVLTGGILSFQMLQLEF